VDHSHRLYQNQIIHDGFLSILQSQKVTTRMNVKNDMEHFS